MRGCLLLFALGVVTACGQQSTTPGTTVEFIDLPSDQLAEGVVHRMTNDGVLSALMHSDTAYIYETTQSMDLRGVNVSFRDERGAEAGVLTSAAGDYNMSINLFIARGDVVLVTPGASGERRLETEELYYDIAAGRLWTDVPFTMTEADGRVTRGTSFRTDATFTTWDVSGVEGQGSPGAAGLSF